MFVSFVRTPIDKKHLLHQNLTRSFKFWWTSYFDAIQSIFFTPNVKFWGSQFTYLIPNINFFSPWMSNNDFWNQNLISLKLWRPPSNFDCKGASPSIESLFSALAVHTRGRGIMCNLCNWWFLGPLIPFWHCMSRYLQSWHTVTKSLHVGVGWSHLDLRKLTQNVKGYLKSDCPSHTRVIFLVFETVDGGRPWLLTRRGTPGGWG